MSAFILSLLDNGNSILFGLPDKLLKRLQSIQHAVARVVSGRRKFDHISDVLRSLHWLPIRFRIEFKIATLVFRCVSGDAPSYLRELVKPYQPTRDLRSEDNSHLTWLCHGRARRNVVSGLFHELPRLSGMSYLSPFDHLPPFWVSTQGWRHTYSKKHLIPDSMFITPWCKLDERFWTFMIKSAIQVNTLHYITLHRKNLNTVFYAG